MSKWEIADRIRENARNELFELLNRIDGMKDLYIDSDLFPLIDLTSTATEIRRCQVEKLHKLDSTLNDQSKNQLLFLLRPNMSRFLHLAKQLRQLNIRKAHLVCVPRKFYAFEHLLEQEGLWGRCILHELKAFDMVPVDYDLFSMVNSHLYLSTYLDHSNDWLATLTESLVDFQHLFGRFSNTLAFGEIAGRVARQLERVQSSITNHEGISGSRPIQTVVLFDRNVDLITPFCSQMCYEGLLDEYFNIDSGRIKIPKSDATDSTAKQFETVSMSTRDDTLMEGVRATHFTKIFQVIKDRLAKENVSQDEFRSKMQDASIGVLKELVQTDVRDRLTAKKQLDRHLNLCTDIYEKKKMNDFKIQLETEIHILETEKFDETVSYIHTMICRHELNKYRPLQLLCLLTATNNGLPKETYETLCRSFLQVYGYENIPLLYKLEKLNFFYVKQKADFSILTGNNTPMTSRGEGILKMRKQMTQNLTDKAQLQKTYYQFMRKRLNLTPKLNEQTKTTPGPDMADVFDSTYVPFSCRLIEMGLINPNRLSEIQHELSQRGYEGFENLFSQRSSGFSTRNQHVDQYHQSVLVVFIGGCTFAEINALRMLALSRNNVKFQFFFAPTSLWTHTRLLQEIENSQ